jgi:hypothetical protein
MCADRRSSAAGPGWFSAGPPNEFGGSEIVSRAIHCAVVQSHCRAAIVDLKDLS